MSAPEDIASRLVSSVVEEILASDEVTRLFGLLQVLSAAESNARLMSLTLTGLIGKITEEDLKRDLLAAIALTDRVVSNYLAASNDACDAIRQRQQAPQASEPAPVLH
jgi:hypothetical protein